MDVVDIFSVSGVLVGLILLCIGGYAIVSGGVSLAKKLRISSMVIGLTVVAYGTSTPELAASILAAFNSHTDLILGNIIGSNISNIGMVIGILPIVGAPLPFMSYGGTSMLTVFAALGIIMSIKSHQRLMRK